MRRRDHYLQSQALRVLPLSQQLAPEAGFVDRRLHIIAMDTLSMGDQLGRVRRFISIGTQYVKSRDDLAIGIHGHIQQVASEVRAMFGAPRVYVLYTHDLVAAVFLVPIGEDLVGQCQSSGKGAALRRWFAGQWPQIGAKLIGPGDDLTQVCDLLQQAFSVRQVAGGRADRQGMRPLRYDLPGRERLSALQEPLARLRDQADGRGWRYWQ